MANRIAIKIGGEELVLLTNDAPEYVRKVGAYVNDQMRLVLKSAKVGQTRAAIMTAVNIADELYKTREQDEQLRNQIKHYLEESSRQKGEISDLKREVLRLQKAQKKMEQEGGTAAAAKPARPSRAKTSRSKTAKAAEPVSEAAEAETGISSKTSRVAALLDKLDEPNAAVEETAAAPGVTPDSAAPAEAAETAPEDSDAPAKEVPQAPAKEVPAEDGPEEIASMEDAPEDRA